MGGCGEIKKVRSQVISLDVAHVYSRSTQFFINSVRSTLFFILLINSLFYM